MSSIEARLNELRVGLHTLHNELGEARDDIKDLRPRAPAPARSPIATEPSFSIETSAVASSGCALKTAAGQRSPGRPCGYNYDS